ncbi:hypothetical protein LJC22_00305 [Desulfosarcina sp. OttesenSCG-928-G10]|nr:hypothetical protein [Desulfosarcina sp. OttesenSCG-928-G10]MDL2320820.1 hypothetical protein [Desulfosarcina sp. OttesenSCG-928-B08]
MVTAKIPPIPWHTPALWQAANAGVRQSMARHHHHSGPAIDAAKAIQRDFSAIFPTLNALCNATCPSCTAICCQKARIWADFKDLVFYHLAGITPPDQQPVSHPGDRCRYSTASGCRLERLQRPFVCTWYLCPAQTALLKCYPDEGNSLKKILVQIQKARRRMEDDFIQMLQSSLH